MLDAPLRPRSPPAHRLPRMAAAISLVTLRVCSPARSRIPGRDRGLRLRCRAGRLFGSHFSTWGIIADSLIPVHAWSHNVSDVVAVAAALEATGHFEVVTPTALLKAVAQNVIPPS